MSPSLKLVSACFTLLIAVLGIAFPSKTQIRYSDPEKNKEKLTKIGALALVLVIFTGGFSVYSEWKSIQDKRLTNDPRKLSAVIQQLRKTQAKQKTIIASMEALVDSLEAQHSSSTPARPSGALRSDTR